MSELVPHAAHWGAFTAETEGGRLTGVRPFPADPAPSPLIAAMPDIAHAPSRIDRPYVRKGWLRGDRKGGTIRGAEEFVPVGWDAAIGLVAEELKRVRAEHGSRSIFAGSYGWSSAGRFHHARTQLHRMLALSGGFTGQVQNYSFAAGMTLLPHLLGNADAVNGPVVDWRAICRHAKLLLCFGGVLTRNGQIASGGAGTHEMGYWVREAARRGVRILNIAPMRADMQADAGAEWLPIRPGTDTALMLAMMHVLLTEGLADRDFLARCTVGIARVESEVLGNARTPAWAAAITGIPAEAIAALARDCARTPTMLTATWSLQRAEFGEQPYWAMIALAAMLGQIGRPGTGFGFGHGSMGGMGNPRAEIPSVGMSMPANPAGSFIPVARVTEMLERPGGEYDFNGQRLRYPDTRLIYWAGGNPVPPPPGPQPPAARLGAGGDGGGARALVDRGRAARRYRAAGDHDARTRRYRLRRARPLHPGDEAGHPAAGPGARRLRHLRGYRGRARHARAFHRAARRARLAARHL